MQEDFLNQFFRFVSIPDSLPSQCRDTLFESANQFTESIPIAGLCSPDQRFDFDPLFIHGITWRHFLIFTPRDRGKVRAGFGVPVGWGVP
jgi:hypothetical protein